MLLNKIPVLDKGYVALLDSSVTTQKMRDIGAEFFGGEYPTSLENLGTMTVAIRCPLFFQLFLAKYLLRVVGVNEPGPIEVFRPNAGEVRANDVLTSEAIVDDISRTADALLINPKAYQADGCETFISQVNTPISVYTTLIVSGDYNEWCKAIYGEVQLPGPIKAYTTALAQILEVEWK